MLFKKNPSYFCVGKEVAENDITSAADFLKEKRKLKTMPDSLHNNPHLAHEFSP